MTRTVGHDLAWRRRSGLFALLLLTALPLALLALARRLLLRRRALVGWREKLSGGGPPLPQGRVLVHGVSLGEVQLMRPLVPRLEQLLDQRSPSSARSEATLQGGSPRGRSPFEDKSQGGDNGDASRRRPGSPRGRRPQGRNPFEARAIACKFHTS